MNEHVKTTGPDDDAWHRLASPSRTQISDAWIELQCGLIAGCVGGWVLRVDARGQLAPEATFPPGAELHRTARRLALGAIGARDGLIEELPEGKGWLLAYPLGGRAAPRGAVVVDLRGNRALNLKSAMRQLQWGAGWSSALLSESTGDATGAFRLFASVLRPRRATDAATALVTELAQRFGLDRASLGFHGRRGIRLAALSHALQPDARMQVVRAIESAMDEAADQQAAIVLPRPGADPGLVTRASAELAAGGGIVALPLTAHDRTVGVLLAERATAFTTEDLSLLEAIAALAGPVLHEKRLNNRNVLAKAISGVADSLAVVLGPRWLVTKTAILAAAMIVAASTVVTYPYEISAPAAVEAEDRRLVPAPFDGYLVRSIARAGDTVKAGDPLAALDDTDLGLERLGLIADREQRTSELQTATARYDLAKAKIMRAEIDQIEARLKLVDLKIQRAVLRAPIGGLVLVGDLSQATGEPVKTGTALFEIAPVGAFRMVVKVDETEIAQAAVGQRGRAILAALPDQALDFVVTRVGPVLEVGGGRNYYRVEGRIAEPPAVLRPGFEGRARLEVGPRTLWWTYTHQLMRWLRLQVWAWLP